MDPPPKKMLSLKQKKLKFTSQQPITSNHLPPALPSSSTVSPSKPAINPSSVVLSGLCNLGNTCYANCILQVLRFCPQFRFEVARLSETFSAPPNVEGECEEETTNQTAAEGAENRGEGELVVCLHTVRATFSLWVLFVVFYSLSIYRDNTCVRICNVYPI